MPQCAFRLESGRREQERAPVREPRPRLDQHAERRRVDELDAGEVDDQPLGLRLAAFEQRLAHLVRVVEIELSREAHDDRAVVSRDT